MKFICLCKVTILCSMILAMSLQALAVDGIAVSVSFTRKRERSCKGWRGDIVRYDIKNSAVVGKKVLFEGIAHNPCISPDGKQVAFFRDGDTWNAKDGRVPGGADFLSVMDIDGGNMRDLIKFDGDLATNSSYRNAEDRLMDWPAGGWIYYWYPHTYNTIWRVNVNNPSKNEKFHDYPGDTRIRRWSLSLDAKFGIGDGIYSGRFHQFPKGNISECGAGCNASISASGRFRSHWGWNPGGAESARIEKYHAEYNDSYNFGKHSSFCFSSWDPQTTKCEGRIGQTAESNVNLAHVSHWLGVDSIGRGMELIRWASNSDKWCIYTVGWAGHASEITKWGCNQLMFNWIQWEPINVSQNPPNTSGDEALSLCNTAGDFWVKPPKDEYIGTHYEDISGKWVPVGTWPTTKLEDVRNSWVITGDKIKLKSPIDAVSSKINSRSNSALPCAVHFMQNGKIQVTNSSAQQIQLNIFSPSGRNISSHIIGDKSTAILHTGRLPSGLYLYTQINMHNRTKQSYSQIIY